MKKILLLATGGTIASEGSSDGLIPSLGIESILPLTVGITEHYDVTARDILHMDSANIQPEEWQVIAQSIFDLYQGYDGIVLTHGTDTMAYTSSILSFMLRDLPLPVVITGSQLPFPHPLSDAPDNLRSAFAMAASGVPGVFVAFNRKIILGTRAVKIRTTGFDAFESVNSPYAAVVDAGGLTVNESVVHRPQGAPRLENQLCPDVFLIKLTPGLNPEIFDMLLEMNYRGVVVEAFGAGGMHFVHRDLISKLQKLSDHGIPVVVCSQCLYERSDLSIYETGLRALERGVIQGMDMTTEAAVTKLIWALGQAGGSVSEVRRLFEENLVGEVSPAARV